MSALVPSSALKLGKSDPYSHTRKEHTFGCMYAAIHDIGIIIILLLTRAECGPAHQSCHRDSGSFASNVKPASQPASQPAIKQIVHSVASRDGDLMQPYPHHLVFSPAANPGSIRTPVQCEHPIQVTRQVFGELAFSYVPHL